MISKPIMLNNFRRSFRIPEEYFLFENSINKTSYEDFKNAPEFEMSKEDLEKIARNKKNS